MHDILLHIKELFTISWLMALVNIIVIDIVMSWDNAIVIGMATRNLPEKLRKKAITIWIVLATIMRICFAFWTTLLLWIVWIRLAWWILLLYVVWKFYKELRNWDNNEEGNWSALKKITLSSAIYTIVIADVSMSLDNVLAVAWASKENLVALWIWLVFSILLMAFASNFIAKNLNKYPIIQWWGLLVILFVAIEMLINWTPDVEKYLHIHNLLPFLIWIVSFIFIVLHQKFITKLREDKIKNYLQNNYLKVITSIVLMLILFVNLWDKIDIFIKSHHWYFYWVNIVLLFCLLEIVSLFKPNKK